jgi:hypothetical protein
MTIQETFDSTVVISKIPGKWERVLAAKRADEVYEKACELDRKFSVTRSYSKSKPHKIVNPAKAWREAAMAAHPSAMEICYNAALQGTHGFDKNGMEAYLWARVMCKDWRRSTPWALKLLANYYLKGIFPIEKSDQNYNTGLILLGIAIDKHFTNPAMQSMVTMLFKGEKSPIQLYWNLEFKLDNAEFIL